MSWLSCIIQTHWVPALRVIYPCRVVPDGRIGMPETSIYAVATHWMESAPTPKTAINLGKATFTMLLSSIAMKAPITSVIMAAQGIFLLPGPGPSTFAVCTREGGPVNPGLSPFVLSSTPNLL